MSRTSREHLIPLALTLLLVSAAALPGLAASEAPAKAEGPGFAATPT
jgi:hypothetical protein